MGIPEYKLGEDLKLKLAFIINGQRVNPDLVPFAIKIWTLYPHRNKTASYDGENWVNCVMREDYLEINLNAPQFNTGRLNADITLHYPDDDMPDKIRDKIVKVRFDNPLINPDTNDVVITGEVSDTIAGLSAYGVAVWNGYEGTEEEWLQSLKQPAIDAAAEAEALMEDFALQEFARVGDENTRKQSELARVTEEQNRVYQELARTNEENTRKQSELARVAEEQNRVNQELARVEEENTREQSELERVAEEQNRVNQELARTNEENTRKSQEIARQNTIAGLGESFDAKIDKTSIKQVLGTSTTDVMSQKAVTDELSTKADHGYESNPKTLKEVDDDLVQLESDVSVLGSNKVSVNPGKNLFNPDAVSSGKYLYFENDSYGILDNAYYSVSDFIPIDSNGLFINKSIAYTPTFICHVIYDSNKNPIGNSRNQNISYITNAAFVRFALRAEFTNIQIESGNSETSYKPYNAIGGYDGKLPDYIPSNIIEGRSIKDNTISYEKTDFVTTGNNLFNKDTAISNTYINSIDGYELANQTGWWCTDFIAIKPNTQYSGTVIRDRAFYDINKLYISGGGNVVYSIITPLNAAYIRYSGYISSGLPDTNMFNEGEILLPYEPYGYIFSKNGLYQNEIEKLQAQIDLISSPLIEVILPDKIYAIVGDTLQLFYRGIIKAWNPYQYDIVINCTKGAWYPRYFEYTPVIADVGTTTLEIKVKDNNGNLLGSKTCQLITKNAIQSPVTNIKTLFLGDSLTNAGIYTQEAFRRLTGTGGTPIGKEFTNIQFVGRKHYGSIFAEGNSGWEWSSYLTVGRKAITFTITSPSVMPTINAIYKDSNNKEYTMSWDYSTTSIKMVVNDMTSTPPASGTLTKVSGTGDATITYSASVQSSGNPFWNDGTGTLDFPAYVNKWLSGTVDVVYTLLTWNGQYGNRTDFSSDINHAKTLFAHIHNNYPDVKIKLMGVQVSDLRGGVRVDGTPTENTYTDTYGLMVTALNMNKAYQDLANDVNYSSYVEFVGVSSQVDSEYNMPYTEKSVNTRFAGVTEKIGTNDVHPNADGYNQIADVVYRNFIANFCQ